MQVVTKRFGAMAVDADKVIEFPAGLVGFEDRKSYTLIHDEAGSGKLHFLQSLDDDELCFTLLATGQYGLTYEIPLDDAESQLLDYQPEDEIVVLVLLSATEGERLRQGQGVTGRAQVIPHILNPIILNTRSRRALQKIIAQRDYDVHIHISQAEERAENA